MNHRVRDVKANAGVSEDSHRQLLESYNEAQLLNERLEERLQSQAEAHSQREASLRHQTSEAMR